MDTWRLIGCSRGALACVPAGASGCTPSPLSSSISGLWGCDHRVLARVVDLPTLDESRPGSARGVWGARERVHRWRIDTVWL